MSPLGYLLASSWVTTYVPHRIVLSEILSVLVALEPDSEPLRLLCLSLPSQSRCSVKHLHSLENTRKTDLFTLQLGISRQSGIWIDLVWNPGGRSSLYLNKSKLSRFISFHSLESARPRSQQLNYMQPRTHWL